jgi:hypothetical protein
LVGIITLIRPMKSSKQSSLVRKLLISIWTRFGNSCTTDRGTVYQNQESVYGIGYYVKNTRCPYLMDGVNPNNFGVGCTIWPDGRQCKMALNSFDIKCVEKKISVPPDKNASIYLISNGTDVSRDRTLNFMSLPGPSWG